MAYQTVIRVAKLTTYGNIAASGEHTWRQRDTPNADSERTPLNEDWRDVHDSKALCEAVKQRVMTATDMSRNHRPVLCLEYLITANAKAFQENGGHIDARAYFQDTLAFLEEKHGKDNIVAVNIQNDEEAPHIVVYAVPLVEEAAKTRKRSVIVGTNPDGTKRRETREFAQEATRRLSAAHFVDGPAKLSKLQTEFTERVGQRHGLERGIEGSRAKRTTTKEYYAGVNAAFAPLPEVKTPAPAPLRPEPVKPGLLAGSAAREAYRVDHEKWERERAAAERQRRQRNEEVKARNGAAIATARRHEAQASKAAALEKQVRELKQSNGYLSRKVGQLEAELATVKGVASLFTPQEVEAAELRKQRQEAERARKLQEAQQKAAGEAHRAEVAAEVQRRVTALPELRKGAGTVYTFGVKAAEAIKQAGGDPGKVDWRAVEAATVREAIVVNGQAPESVASAITGHSPGCADPKQQDAIRAEIHHLAPRLQKLHERQQEQQQAKTNSGPQQSR